MLSGAPLTDCQPSTAVAEVCVLSPPMSGGGTSRVSGACILKFICCSTAWRSKFGKQPLMAPECREPAGSTQPVFLVCCFSPITNMISLFVYLTVDLEVISNSQKLPSRADMRLAHIPSPRCTTEGQHSIPFLFC